MCSVAAAAADIFTASFPPSLFSPDLTKRLQHQRLFSTHCWTDSSVGILCDCAVVGNHTALHLFTLYSVTRLWVRVLQYHAHTVWHHKFFTVFQMAQCEPSLGQNLSQFESLSWLFLILWNYFVFLAFHRSCGSSYGWKINSCKNTSNKRTRDGELERKCLTFSKEMP